MSIVGLNHETAPVAVHEAFDRWASSLQVAPTTRRLFDLDALEQDE